MQISWWTLALQVVNFLVLVWLLQRFLYRPVRDILEQRKRQSTEALAAAERAKAETEAARQRYEEARGALAEERQATLEAAHRASEAERTKRIEEAKKEAQKIIDTAHASIAEERAKTLTGLEADVADLAVKLAEKLLDKLGGSIAGDVFLERTQAALKELPDSERRRLERDLAVNGALVTVVTAAPLDAKEQKEWQARLEANLERPLKIAFDVDPKLIAGAAIHFPHVVVSFDWADQLKDARQALLSGNHEKLS
jgi:F-type H+-transporting ATPase subunit b